MMRSIFGLLISPLFVLFVVWPQAWAQLNDFDRQEFTFENALAGKNPGFESGTVQWTASGGTFVVNSGTQIVPNSKQFATWDSNSAGQTLQTAAVTVPKTGNCEFSIWIAVPSGTATHTITVTDGTNDIVTAQTITNNTNALKHIVNFPCPSSGTVRGKLTSVASNEPSIILDNGRLGIVTNVGTVAQAFYKGSISMSGCTNWFRSNTAFGDFTATSGCTYAVTGDVLAPSTFIPGFRLQNVAPGRYLIIARGSFGKSVSTTNADISFRFSDGTNTFAEQIVIGAATASGLSLATGELTGTIGYTTAQGTLTYQLQAKTSNTASGTQAFVSDDSGANATGQITGLQFEVFYFPSHSQQVVMPDAQGWYAAGNISGANPSLGVGNVSTFTEITSASLTLTPKSGSAPVGIMCSGTNAAATPSTSSTTCSAGSESIGFNVSVPRSGAYEICFHFAHNMSSNSNAAGVTTFQVIRTPTNSQTISEEGGGKTHSGNAGGSTAGTGAVAFMSRTACGNFNLSAGINGFRLMYEQNVGATPPATSDVVADAYASAGQRDIYFLMKPISQQQQAILANSVSTGTVNGERIERARLNCDASSAITSQSGGASGTGWITSISNVSTNQCTLTLAAGNWPSTIQCTAVVVGSSGNAWSVNIGSISTSAIVSVGLLNGSSSLSSYDFDIICMGPR